MDNVITAAGLNGGYLMRRQLNDLGVSDAEIRRSTRSGFLHKIRHGTYAIGAVWNRASVTERHRITAWSILDKLGPGVVASHQTAAALHGFDLYDIDIDAVHVTRLDGRTGRSEAGVVHHEGNVADSDIIELDGRLVTHPMRSVFETASVASVESGMVVASSALRDGGFDKSQLIDHGAHYAHWLGTRTARLAIRLADSRLESVGEVRSLHMMWRHHVPKPELQFVIIDRNDVVIARTDFAWIEQRHTGEFDGLVKYGRLNPHTSDPGQAIVAEKIREDAVRDLDHGMSRWTWASLDDEAQSGTARMLLAGIERSRRLFTRGRTIIA